MTKHNFLFYCCFFAPSFETGAIRPTKLAKYFSKFNQKIIVLTQTSLDEKNKDLLNGIEDIKIYRQNVKSSCLFTIKVFGSIETYKKLKELIQKYNIEFLFVSGPPFTPFISAYILAKKFNLKLIIDYRDLWYGDPYPIVSIKDFFFRAVGKIIEKKIMANALKVNFISNNMKKDQEKIFGVIKNSIVVSTGVDHEDLKIIDKDIYNKFLDKNNVNHNGKIFFYIGTLDETECSKDFFDLLYSMTLNKKCDFKIIFIGKNKFDLNKYTQFNSLKPHIRFIPRENLKVIKSIIRYSHGTIILGGYSSQRLNRKVFENLLLTNNIFFLGNKDSPSYKLLKKFSIQHLSTNLENKDKKLGKFKNFLTGHNSLDAPPKDLKYFYKAELSKEFLSKILE